MRQVCEVPGHGDAFLESVNTLSPDCVTSLYFYLEALETEDPEVSEPQDEECELCGVIDLSYELFCATIPGCRTHRLVLTIDRAEARVFVHALLRGRSRNCAEAYRIAAAQLQLDDKPWEPRHD